MAKRIGALLVLILLLTSCLKENTVGCAEGNVLLSLKYTLNVDDQDQIKEKIGYISLYIFDDATGLLTKIEPIDQQQILSGRYATDLLPGSYTLVAWAVDGRDMTEGGYFAVDMTDLETDSYTTPAIGRTKMDNFRVRLKTNDAQGYKTPASILFDELYHASARNVQVTGLEQTISFNFTKNTNLLKIRVEGLDHLANTRTSTQPVELFVMGTDDRYNAHNHAGTHTMPLRYQQPVTYPDANTAESNISILRLDMELHQTHPILLHLLRTDTGKEITKPIDLLAMLLKMKDKEGNPVFKTQQDLDRWDEFPIVLKIGLNLGVSITIGDFIIEDTTGGLD